MVALGGGRLVWDDVGSSFSKGALADDHKPSMSFALHTDPTAQILHLGLYSGHNSREPNRCVQRLFHSWNNPRQYDLCCRDLFTLDNLHPPSLLLYEHRPGPQTQSQDLPLPIA